MSIFSRSGADFFTVYADFSRFVRDINGEKKKHLLIDDLFHGQFFTVCPLSRTEKKYPKRPPSLSECSFQILSLFGGEGSLEDSSPRASVKCRFGPLSAGFDLFNFCFLFEVPVREKCKKKLKNKQNAKKQTKIPREGSSKLCLKPYRAVFVVLDTKRRSTC